MKNEIVYGSEKEIFFPLKGENMYAELKLQKDGKYKPTGKLVSASDVSKIVEKNNKKKKAVKSKKVDTKTLNKLNAELTNIVSAMCKGTKSLPDSKKMDAMLNSVRRQAIIGDKIIPEMVRVLSTISKSIEKSNVSIREIERNTLIYSDPLYIKKQILKFNIAVAKKDNEIAGIDFARTQLDKSSPKFNAESAALDLKEAVAMNKFANAVGRLTDPLLNLRRSITTRMDAMASTIKSIVNSVNKIASLSVPKINYRTLRGIGRSVNKTYTEAFRILETINNGLSIEVIKAKMGWKESGVNRYATITKTDDNGNPYKVYLTKKEFDQKTGLMKDVRVENPDWFQPHFEAEDAMMMVGSFITRIVDLSKQLTDVSKYRITSPIRTSIKLRILARDIRRLIRTTSKAFSNIDSVGLRYAISSLVGTETNLSTINTTQNPDGVVDQINSVMTTKQPGVVGAISALLSTIKYITDIDFGPITLKSIKSRIKIRLAGRSIRKLVDSLIMAFPPSIDVDPKNGIDYRSIYDGAIQMSQAIAFTRDQFSDINANIEDLSNMIVERKTIRIARRRIKRAIKQYSRIFDTIITELDRRTIESKRKECSELIEGMSKDISAVVTMVDKLGALKSISRRAIRGKRRLNLIRDELVGFKDLMVELADGYSQQKVVDGRNVLNTVSGILPIFVSDLIYITTKASKLEGKEKSIDNLHHIIEEYADVAKLILGVLPMYSNIDAEAIVKGNKALERFLSSIPLYREISKEMGNGKSIGSKEMNAALRTIQLITESAVLITELGKNRRYLGRGISAAKKVKELFSTFTEKDIESIKTANKVFSSKKGLVPLCQSLTELVEALQKLSIKKIVIARISVSQSKKLITKLSELVSTIYTDFGGKRNSKKLKETNDALVVIVGTLANLYTIETYLVKLGALSIIAQISPWIISKVIFGLVNLTNLLHSDFGGKKDQKKLRESKKGLTIVKGLLESLMTIEVELIKLTALSIPATLGALGASLMLCGLALVLLTTEMAIGIYDKLKKKKNIGEKLKDISVMLNTMLLIELKLTGLAVLAIPATLGAIGAAMMLAGLTGMLFMTYIMSGIYDLLGEDINDCLKGISLILCTMLLIELELIALGILAIPAALGGAGAMVMLGALIGVLFMLNIVASMSGGIGRRTRRDMRNLALIFGTLVIIELELIAIGLLAIPAAIGAAAAMLIMLLLTGVMKILSRFITNIALGSLAVALLSLSLLVAAQTFSVVAGLVTNWDWNSLWKIPLLVLAMAIPFTIIGIPIVAGLTALGALVMLLVAWTYKKIALSINEIAKVDVDSAEQTIESVSDVFKKMVDGLRVMNVFEMGLVAGDVAVMLDMTNGYSKMLDMIQRIAEMRVPTGYDSEGNPTGYTRMTSSVFEDTKHSIDSICDIMEYMTDKMKRLDEIADSSVLRGGKRNMKIITRTINPINKILDFIVKLSSDSYKLPIYLDDGITLDQSVGNGGYMQINLAEYLRRQGPIILDTVDKMFELVTKIADRVEALGEGEDSVKNTRRGKRRLKIVKRALDPINEILNFIVQLSSNNYDLPIYGTTYNNIGEITSLDGLIETRKINLAEYIRHQKPFILKTIDDMFDLVNSIAAKVEALGQDNEKGTMMSDTRRGKRRLKVINRALGPINEILDFIVKMSSNSFLLPLYGPDGVTIDKTRGEEGYMKITVADYLRNNKDGIMQTVTNMFEFVNEIASKVETLGNKSGNENVMGNTRRGKRRLKVVNRAMGPINDILDFIIKLSSNEYELPIYNEDWKNLDQDGYPAIGPNGNIRKVNIAEYIRTQKGTILRTVTSMFEFMAKMADSVENLGNRDGVMKSTRRGKRRLKIVTRTMEPINDILDFIIKLNEEYTMPVYKEDAEGNMVLDTTQGDRGYIKTNIADYIRVSSDNIEETITSMFSFITKLGDEVAQLGGGWDENNGVGWSARQARRGKRRLKIISETVEPLNDILNFIVTLESGEIDTGEVDENGNPVKIKVSDIVRNQKNANSTIETLIGIANSIGNTVEMLAGKKDSGLKNVSEKNVSKVAMITEVVTPLVGYVNSMSELKTKNTKLLDVDDKNNIFGITDLIVNTIDRMFSVKLMTDGKFKDKNTRMETLYKRIKDFTTLKSSDGFKDAVQATSDMVESINSINDSKIDRLNRLMVNMTKFGETMDEALKEVFDKVVELAEELHYIIEADLKKNNPEEYKRQKQQEQRSANPLSPKNQQQPTQNQSHQSQTNVSKIEEDLASIESYIKQIKTFVVDGNGLG